MGIVGMAKSKGRPLFLFPALLNIYGSAQVIEKKNSNKTIFAFEGRFGSHSLNSLIHGITPVNSADRAQIALEEKLQVLGSFIAHQDDALFIPEIEDDVQHDDSIYEKLHTMLSLDHKT